MTTGLLLINLGTPDAPTTAAVRRYLREFLSDPRVLDMHPVLRWLLLNGVILLRRPQRSAAQYRSIWTDAGSPLLVHGRALAEKLAARLGPEARVQLAMRYGHPSIASALQQFRAEGISRITVFPLFPHYASSSWGSAVAKVYAEAARWWNTPALTVVPPYYDHPAYLHALRTVAQPVLDQCKPDHLLISFHGIPVRHIRKSGEGSAFCYRTQCEATAAGLIRALGWPPDRTTISYQSRLGRDPWVQPFTDHVIPQLAARGIRRLAVACPSFVADCLETLEEIGERARTQFTQAGGESLTLIPALNSHDVWVEVMCTLLDTNHCQS